VRKTTIATDEFPQRPFQPRPTPSFHKFPPLHHGSQFIKTALVKPGVPMEVILNKESKRKTPFELAIRKGERFFSDAATKMVLFD